jgi:preprotein translocase subunit YajC
MPIPGFHILASLGILAAATKKTSSSSGFFLIFLIIIAGVYLLFIAPQRRKQRARMAQQKSFEPGDEVMTTGGIYGRVEASEGDRVALDVADGVVIEVARSAIAHRVDDASAGALRSRTDETSEQAASSDEEHWAPPAEAEVTTANGASVNGTTAASEVEWGAPWSTPPVDGEKGAPGAGGSA